MQDLTPVAGTLVGEPLPYNEAKSINSLFRGQVQLADGTVKSCLLKNIDRIETVNELVANLVAKKLNLPIPTAVLTFVPDAFNSASQFSKSHVVTGGVLTFASVDAQTPNLLQRLSSAHPMGRKIIEHSLRTWTQKGGLYGFDTWVANVDRHVGNLLFGNNNDIWLIDHGRCFTKENWKPSDLVPNVTYQNKLKLWYTNLLGLPERQEVATHLASIPAELSKFDIGALLSDSLATSLTTQQEQIALHSFLTARIGRVAPDGVAALQP